MLPCPTINSIFLITSCRNEHCVATVYSYPPTHSLSEDPLESIDDSLVINTTMLDMVTGVYERPRLYWGWNRQVKRKEKKRLCA